MEIQVGLCNGGMGGGGVGVGHGGGVRIRLYEPVKDKPRRAGLVYIHGGGWVYGNTSRFM